MACLASSFLSGSADSPNSPLSVFPLIVFKHKIGRPVFSDAFLIIDGSSS